MVYKLLFGCGSRCQVIETLKVSCLDAITPSSSVLTPRQNACWGQLCVYGTFCAHTFKDTDFTCSVALFFLMLNKKIAIA